MSKSQKTYELEEIITLATARADRIGCPEVGLDDYGIVDFISMDIGGEQTVRCYELKISRSDFLSDAKKTFIGDFNYYVIPSELWMDVHGHVEPGIGVWTVDDRGHVLVKKKAEKMKCQMSRSRIMGKILRALNRENLKHCESNWKLRQSRKRTAGASGGDIQPGDTVKYHGDEFTVLEIDYKRDQMSLKPVCVLESSTGEQIDVKPSVLVKVLENDVEKTRLDSRDAFRSWILIYHLNSVPSVPDSLMLNDGNKKSPKDKSVLINFKVISIVPIMAFFFMTLIAVQFIWLNVALFRVSFERYYGTILWFENIVLAKRIKDTDHDEK